MTRYVPTPDASDGPASGRPLRALLLAASVALASGVAVASWPGSDDVSLPPGASVPHGALLDRLLDQAQASPTQRAQARQIFDAADADLRQGRAAERADHQQLAQLFAQPTVDAAAIEAVRGRIEQRHDQQSRRATQALIDVGLVLTPQQRQAIAPQLAGGPRPFGAFLHHPHAASAAND
jgi:Spy/CpxP family protein refolding chaperone